MFIIWNEHTATKIQKICAQLPDSTTQSLQRWHFLTSANKLLLQTCKQCPNSSLTELLVPTPSWGQMLCQPQTELSPYLCRSAVMLLVLTFLALLMAVCLIWGFGKSWIWSQLGPSLATSHQIPRHSNRAVGSDRVLPRDWAPGTLGICWAAPFPPWPQLPALGGGIPARLSQAHLGSTDPSSAALGSAGLVPHGQIQPPPAGTGLSPNSSKPSTFPSEQRSWGCQTRCQHRTGEPELLEKKWGRFPLWKPSPVND